MKTDFERTARRSFSIDACLLLARRVYVFPIRLYQRFISPILQADCRFYPSCSAYAIEAVMSHGILKGSLLAAWRLLRCNPWSEGGYDPVPPTLNGGILPRRRSGFQKKTPCRFRRTALSQPQEPLDRHGR